MPIRLRDSTAVVGRIRSTLGDSSSTVAGTHTAPPSRTGLVFARLDELVPSVIGQFQAAPNRTGTIATTLANVTASESGIASPPPIPNRTGTVATTLAGVSADIEGTAPSTTSLSTWWPNWPIMNVSLVQGAGPGDLDASQAADKDLIMFQSFYPTTTRLQNRCDAIDNILAQQDPSKIQTRFFQYLTPAVTYKDMINAGNNERAFNLEMILDPVTGNNNWRVHRVGNQTDSGICETLFAPTTDAQANIVVGAGLNSLGEDYATAYWKKYNSAWSSAYKSRLSGVFHDVFNQRPAQMFQNDGATAINDPDYDVDGVADPRAAFGTGAGKGGTLWAQGGINTKAKFEARFPGKVLAVNAARWDFDYIDGQGDPPLPLSAAPFYHKFEFPLDESVHGNLSLTPTGTGWTVTGTPGATGRLQAFFRAYYIIEAFMRTEADIGSAMKGAVFFQSSCNDRVPTSDDLAAIRFLSLAPLLVERGAPCCSAGAARLFSLDELLVELGSPLATRSMGTFSETTAELTIRSPDFTNGVAKFFWAQFTKGIVVIRGDTPSTGTYPSADAALTCTLPSPGAGKKWQRFNASNYVNPITGRATRNQDPALNSGADSAIISLKPYHAMLLRKVDA